MTLTKVTGHVVLPTTNIEFHNTKSTGIVTFAHTSNATSATTGALQITGGVGIVKDLFVGGNITVGGTITYDDVTNIDSLGIVTARTDIHLGQSLAHLGDLGTKITFDTNEIKFDSASEQRLCIRPDGKIGITTTTPTAQLSIGNTTGNYLNTTGIQINRPHQLGLQNSVHAYTNISYNQSADYYAAAFKATAPGGIAVGVSTDAGSDGLGGTLNARIDFDGDSYFAGNMGIGTVTAATKLHVDGGNITIRNGTAAGVILSEESGVGGSLKVTTATGNASFGSGNSTFCHVQTDRGSFYFNKRAIVDEGIISSYDENLRIDAPINTPRIYIDKDNGKVGIGSDVPSRPLSIKTGDATVHLLNGNGGIYMGTDNTGGFIKNCAIARSGATNYHIAGSTAGDLCIGGEAGQSMIFGLSHAVGAMHQAIHISRLRQFHFYYGSQDFRICTGDQSSNVPRVVVDSSGRVLLGTSSSRDTRSEGSAYSGQLQMESEVESALTMTRFGSTHPSRLNLQHARGTIASIAAAQENDHLGQISFSGWDGDTFTNAAEIRAEVDGPPGDDDMPGRLVFFTTGDNAYVPTERLRITSGGDMGLGTNSPNSYSDQTVFTINGTNYGRLDLEVGGTLKGSVWADSGGLGLDAGGNEIEFYAGSAERLRITSDGEVGISPGSVTPTAGDLQTGDSQNKPLIHVKGSGVSATGGEYNLIGRFEAGGDADDTGAMVVLNHSNDRGLALIGGRATSNNAFAALKMIDNVGRLTDIMTVTGYSGQGVGNIKFFTGNSTTTTERIRITGDGKIGISDSGTMNTPETTLHVENNVDHSSGYYLNTHAAILVDNQHSSGKAIIKLEHDAALVYGAGSSTFTLADRQNDRMHIKTDGDVMWNGINTQIPGHGNTTVGMGFEPRNGSIFLSRGDSATIFSNRNGDGSQIGLKYSGSDKFNIGLADSGATFRISSGSIGGGTSRFEIDSNGHTRATVRARTFVTSYEDAITNTGGCLTGGDNSQDAWIFNWYDSASWGIYSRNIDSTLTVNGFGLPQNSTAFIGATKLKAYINHESGEICGSGGFLIDGESTTTNQAKGIRWTAYDKEGTSDRSDTAGIIHTVNQEGLAGGVLRIYSNNDANDGIVLKGGLAAGDYGTRVINGLQIRSGGLRPTAGTGENGIMWPTDPYSGSGDKAHIQYHQDGSGENTQLRIQCENDADDDILITANGGVTVTGTFTKPGGSFRIPHVLAGLTTTTDLVHSFIEGPQADNLYRGRTTLVAGISTVNIDTTNNMTEGTFVNLNRDVQCFTSNETGWTAVKGSVTGNLLTIVAQDNTCTDTISWMVVGERWDLHMYDPHNPMTDENGKVRTEVPNKNYNRGGGFKENYIIENKLRVGISTISRPSIENKEVE